MKSVLLIAFLVLLISGAGAQVITPCTTPGQNPSTAFPVCGTSIFVQNTVPLCGGRILPSPACAADGVTDINPFWYSFSCFQSGSLGFLITPKNLSDDYDWEVYDITGLSPNAIYTNGSIVIGSNWSGESGVTGASPAGTQQFVCAGYGKPLFSKMPNIQQGHNYLMLVSHFTQTQSGYSLQFTGGTAVITDSVPPAMKSAVASCGADVIHLNINKKIRCSSISADGSEFYIIPANANVVSSTGLNCSTKFDDDNIDINLSAPLSPGNYTLHIKKGSDGNTLLDFCNNEIPDTNTVQFVVTPQIPTPFDSISPVKCSPNSLKVVFSKPVLCSTVASDGTDFVLSGNYPAVITGANPVCSGSPSTTTEIIISLNSPLQQKGTFQLILQKGSDGNTVINECGKETPAGSFVSFSVNDTVNADFAYTINYGCLKDIVDFTHAGLNGVNSWQWDLDDNISSTQQNPSATYVIINAKHIRLAVSNGFCSDTISKRILLDNYFKADFTVPVDNCPIDPVVFTATSIGKIGKQDWSFGDGGTGSGSIVTHSYSQPSGATSYVVSYTATNSFGCQQTVNKNIKIYPSCIIAVPNAFTPNGDGHNDFLYPLNAVKAEQLHFRVFNRWGQMVFSTDNWKFGWDGRINGQLQPTGPYVWILTYIDRDTKKFFQKKGTTVLIR